MLKYRGGKSHELPEIMKFVPTDFDRYVEPFFGGGALFFSLEPERAILNDLNLPLMNFYRGIRDDFETVSSELELLHSEYEANRAKFEALKETNPDSRVEDDNEKRYYELRDMFNRLRRADYSDATLYYYINKTAYSGMIRYNKKGEFNVPYGRYKHLMISGITQGHSDLLKKTVLMRGDFQHAFDQCHEGDFVFLDPPYDCVFSDYGNPELGGSFSQDDHERLASAFYALPCKALLVIGKTELTERLYGDSIVHEYDKSYSVNIRNRFKSESKHILVANGR